MFQAIINCRLLFRQAIEVPAALALAKAGRRSAARMAMIAITTSNSISVKAFLTCALD